MLANQLKRSFSAASSLLSRRIYLQNLPHDATKTMVSRFVASVAGNDAPVDQIMRHQGSSHALVFMQNKEDVDSFAQRLDGQVFEDDMPKVSASTKIEMKEG